jgi:hypothetical protein
MVVEEERDRDRDRDGARKLATARSDFRND